MKKRFLFIFAILTMLCTCCLFASAQENEPVVVDNVVYQLVADTEQEAEHYKLISFFDSEETKKTRTEITIPSEIDGVPVTEIAYNNSYSNGYGKAVVEKITLPDTIEIIGTQAFVYMRNLKDINIPSSVTTIGKTAFASCTGLTEITISENVRDIGQYCFKYCSNLKKVEILGNGLKVIRKWAFDRCINLESINLPDSLKVIGRRAFYQSGPKTLRIPGKCVIGYEAFSGCNVKKLVFEDRTDKNDAFISRRAFSGVNLEKVYLPKKSVAFKIPDSAFACPNLVAVYRTQNVKAIDSWAFKELKTFTIPEGIESIAKEAFSNCTGLKKLRVLTTNTKFLTIAKELDHFNFLENIPSDCKIYVKTNTMRQAFVDAGCTNKVIVKSDLK